MSNPIKLIQAYTQAMYACMENAKQWLEDAKILAKHNSKVHCRVLQNFAGEELAKAAGCWLVINKHLPYNHPLVQLKSGTGIFRNHDAKNLVMMVLGALVNLLILLEQQNQPITKNNLEKHLQNPLIDSVYLDLALFGEEKRRKWLYVDIYQINDSYEVSDPLKIEVDDFFTTLTAKTMKQLSKVPEELPLLEKLLLQAINELVLSIIEQIKGGYEIGLRTIQFVEQLIQNPRSDVALIFQEKIQTTYKLFKQNKKRIKKRRTKGHRSSP